MGGGRCLHSGPAFNVCGTGHRFSALGLSCPICQLESGLAWIFPETNKIVTCKPGLATDSPTFLLPRGLCAPPRVSCLHEYKSRERVLSWRGHSRAPQREDSSRAFPGVMVTRRPQTLGESSSP